MKKLIDRIRNANTWRERVEIAQDKLPVTPFNYVVEMALDAQRHEEFIPHIAREEYEKLGKWLALKIRKGESQLLHDLASAVAVWKRHKPRPDYDLITLFSMSGMFPHGWEKTWGMVNGKLVPGYSRIPSRTRVKVAMRDIKRNIKRIDQNFKEDQWERRRKRIQRYAKQFKIPLDNTPSSQP